MHLMGTGDTSPACPGTSICHSHRRRTGQQTAFVAPGPWRVCDQLTERLLIYGRLIVCSCMSKATRCNAQMCFRTIVFCIRLIHIRRSDAVNEQFMLVAGGTSRASMMHDA